MAASTVEQSVTHTSTHEEVSTAPLQTGRRRQQLPPSTQDQSTQARMQSKSGRTTRRTQGKHSRQPPPRPPPQVDEANRSAGSEACPGQPPRN
eukprot:4570035-Amphidinium_carterae.1